MSEEKSRKVDSEIRKIIEDYSDVKKVGRYQAMFSVFLHDECSEIKVPIISCTIIS